MGKKTGLCEYSCMGMDVMSDKDQWKKDTARFNRIFFRAIVFSLIIGLAIGLGFNLAKAEDTPTKTLAAKYPDPFVLMQRAQYCYAIDWDGQPLPDEVVTPHQQKWRRVFLATQWVSVKQGHDLFSAGYLGETGLVFSETSADFIGYDSCVEEVDQVLSVLGSLLRDVYLPPSNEVLRKTLQNLDTVLQSGTYPDALRQDEEYWCYAQMDTILETLDSDPSVFQAHVNTPVYTLKASFAEQKTFWGEHAKTGYKKRNMSRTLKNIIDGLYNPGLGTDEATNKTAVFAFFLAAHKRCAYKAGSLRRESDGE